MEDSDSEADAMAQAMGFSSFGSQSNKRRKYNPHLDEAVTASSGGALPDDQNEDMDWGAGSGSNNIPLGVRTSNNRDEIMLDDELDNDDDGGGAATREAKDDDDPEPQYIDTSRPSMPVSTTDPAGDVVQSKIDAILGTTSNDPDLSAQSVPLNLTAAQGSRGGYGGRGGRQSGRGGHHGGQSWWEDYYDPTANMNPWERLEKERAMEPTDSWLSWEESKSKWDEVKTQHAVEGTST
jgi:hypothetical protein